MNGTKLFTLNGREVGVKFGLMAIELLSEKADKKMTASEAAIEIVWAGYRNWCYVKQVETVPFEEFVDWIEEQSNTDTKLIEELIAEFQESKHLKEQTKKKTTPKLIGKKPKPSPSGK